MAASPTRVSDADFNAISDHMGRYCWHVDSGEGDEWAALWTEDGVFTGPHPEPVVGREALKRVPLDAFEQAGGKIRHMVANLHCDYIDGDKDKVRARYYNFVTSWVNGGAFACMAIAEVVLVRDGDGWLIQRNHSPLYR
jgi:ketosteroid isomerase-like protein